MGAGDATIRVGCGARRRGRRPLTAHAGFDGRRAGDGNGAGGVLALFYAHDGHGYLNPRESERIDKAIVDECHRLAAEQPA